MTFFRIALGNLRRNSRRTVSTLLAILIGVTMIVFVNGFNSGLYNSWARGIINGSDGHFKLRHKDYEDNASTNMEKILIADPASLEAELRKNPHVVGVMPRIRFGGLVGQENKSTPFFGAAADVSVLHQVLPDNGEIIVAGENLNSDDPMGALLGKRLAENLDVKVGDELVILSNSIYAEQTAIVINVKGLVSIPGAADFEAMFLTTGIKQVQNDLLDMGSGATELVVRIDDDDNLEAVIASVNRNFEEIGQPWVADPWYSDKMFQQVTGMFKGIGLVISIILSLIVGIVISNALMMSVFERIREIGTLRAIGTEKKQVYKIFYSEAFLTTVFGILLGLLLGSILIWITGKTGITMPGEGGEPVTIHPEIQLSNLISSSALPIVVTMVAVWFPIKSSCKMNIVDALNFR
ncbi:FtsX-like permease family protein [bacterium]|nr:FtsX-like permease family protein [bacterium]